MKTDLHCHSHFSDGACSLEWLVARATDNGVTHLAITDHDCLTDCRSVQTEQLTLIPGVEISCAWQELEIHVVGLNVDHDCNELSKLLEHQQQVRKERMGLIADKLRKLGIDGLEDYLTDLPAKAYTRSHVANFLVAKGDASNRQNAFKKFLAKGSKAYAPVNWCDLPVAIAAIRAAGGVAILAHPGRYPLNKRRLEALVGDFAKASGDALEVRYPNIDPNMMKRLESLGQQNQLLFSFGSDFHDPAATWTDIGKFPYLRGEAEQESVLLHPRLLDLWAA